MRKQPQLRKRHAFYVMGFDPRGTSYYHAQLRREARISARRGFSHFKVGKLESNWQYGEQCHCELSQDPSLEELQVEFLSITDIVRGYFDQSIVCRLINGLGLLWVALSSGFAIKVIRKAPQFALFTFYAFILLFLGFFTAVGLGMGAALFLDPDYALAGGILTTLALLGVITAFLIRLENRLYTFYLLGGFVFEHNAITGHLPVLEQRMESFVERIVHVLNESGEDEEVLLIGHSNGGLLAIRLAAAILRQCTPKQASRFSLLTLGNQAALAYYPGTEGFLSDVKTLAETPGFTWRDIFAPQDAISSGRFDPLKELNIPRPSPCSLTLHSARFKEVLTASTYQRLRYNVLKLHMQYLKASETGNGFNYLKTLESPDWFSKLKI